MKSIKTTEYDNMTQDGNMLNMAMQKRSKRLMKKKEDNYNMSRKMSRRRTETRDMEMKMEERMEQEEKEKEKEKRDI